MVFEFVCEMMVLEGWEKMLVMIKCWCVEGLWVVVDMMGCEKIVDVEGEGGVMDEEKYWRYLTFMSAMLSL